VAVQPIERLTRQEASRLEGLLFDLDDTLLDRGRLTEPAYSALFRLRESGLSLVAVTGRPSGWGELLARLWPVEGVVTENGAIGWCAEPEGLTRIDPVGASERARRRARVQEIAAALRERFEELTPADDVAARVSDFTFDIGEHRRVEPARVREVEASARELGARTLTSSVHLHVTLDADDKASGVLRMLRALGPSGGDPTALVSRWAFIGDSDNDAACFAAFRTTIGVANFRGRPSVPPRFLTARERGAGFAEAARLLCERRGIGACGGVR
jgi:HAD superfamily hydrolase (TIGR01484 family)